MMASGTVTTRGIFLALGFVLLSGSSSSAQVKAPSPPPEYKAQIRYRLQGTPYQRLAEFLALKRHLEAVGFTLDPDAEFEAESPEQTRVSGTISSANARRLLANPRILTVMLVPAGHDLSAEPDKLVRVQLELPTTLQPDRQRVLAEQTRSVLEELGFQEAQGYDNQRHGRLVGTIAANKLDNLLEDLRWQATGWLAPRTAVADLPSPIRETWPVRLIEITPEPAGLPTAAPLPAAPEVPENERHLLKIPPDLRERANQDERTRIEVILTYSPGPEDVTWQRALVAAAPVFVEGRLGPLVTVEARPNQAADLARLGIVSTVRLPRPAVVLALPASQPPGLPGVNTLPQRGKGSRIAIIDSDFRGYEQHLARLRPGQVQYVDVASECRYDLMPTPQNGADPGHGTQCALAAALAAPEAHLTLVRIDADAPYQLLEVARFLNGEPVRSENLRRRSDELAADRDRLENERERLLAERQVVLERFGQDKASVERREAYFKQQAAFEKDELALVQRGQRYARLLRDLEELRNIRIVSCSLVWQEAYPVNGTNALSRYLDDRPLRNALWFQSAGDISGRAWAGFFRDGDGNGVMEFAPPEAAPRPDRWTSELNFLGWHPFAATQTPELPKTRLRIAIQWREPHDPSLWTPNEDLYRQPVADVGLTVLRQRDPSGTKVATDDLVVVARSTGLPQRLDSEPASAVYEQTVEFAVDDPGRFALQVQGRVPPSIRPSSVVSLPAHRMSWELRPRIVVSVIDEASRLTGRPVFLDYTTQEGIQGMPADAQRLIVIDAASPIARGGQITPELPSLDGLAVGSAQAKAAYGSDLLTAYAAGLAAQALSRGASQAAVYQEWHRCLPGLVPPISHTLPVRPIITR